MKTTYLIPFLSICGLILTGCENVGENTKRNAAIGAGVGAVAGGIAGSDDGDAASGAAMGAAVGAAAGGAYGNYQDRQEAEEANEASTARRAQGDLPVTDYDNDGIVDTQDDFIDIDGDGLNDKDQLEQEGYVYSE